MNNYLNQFELSDIVCVTRDRYTKTQRERYKGRIGIVVEIDRSKTTPLIAVQFHNAKTFPLARLYYTPNNLRLASGKEVREELSRVLLGTDVIM